MTAPVTTTTSLPLQLPAALRPLPSPPRSQLVARVGLGRPSRRALLRCAAVSELAPAASAAYGALLLGGGDFAYARSRSKGSIFGGLSGSALMSILQNTLSKNKDQSPVPVCDACLST